MAGRDLSGTTLGGYRLVRKIAEGGMGEVYEAIQTTLDRKVALKILTEQLAGRPEFLQRFEREAKTAAALNHPNLVQVYDYGEANGLYYLIMEFVDGEDLAAYVARKGKLPVTECLNYLEQAVQALKAACAQSIIHRDIKPGNLMLTRDGRLKVADLGLAKMIDDDSDLTMTGVPMGSPHFLAPEQADDARHVDHRADIYSLGITLFFLLTGKRPYEGSSAFSVVLAHGRKPLPSALEMGTELPENVENFLHHLTAKNPADRYPDYDALLADLERVKKGQAPSARTSDKKNTSPWSLARRALAGLACVLIVGLLVVIAWPVQNAGSAGNGRAAAPKPRANQTLPADNPQPGAPNPEELRGFLPDRPGPDFREGAGQTKTGFRPSTQRFPLAGLPRAERNPLADGPVETMLAEAEAFAQANPTRPVKVLDRYFQVQAKAAGTPLAAEINAKIKQWITTHDRLVSQTIGEFNQRSFSFLEARQPQKAYEVWLKFPIELRTPEVDRQIRDVLEERFPSEFVPR